MTDTETPRPMSDERKAFEAWARPRNYDCDTPHKRSRQLMENPINPYGDTLTNHLFQLWRELHQPTAQSEVDENFLMGSLQPQRAKVSPALRRSFDDGILTAYNYLRPYITQRPVDLEDIAAKLWRRDYPHGCSRHKTYESTHEYDKDLYRKEIKFILDAAQTPYTEKGGR